jgi:tetratricopeptide (TPR) repeat protein
MRDQQTGTESKTPVIVRQIEQINTCLRSGDYSRALELLRSTAAEFPNDAELSELEKLAQDGVRRNAEAQRLITKSQELFAQRKSAEGIQLLREAYELDKNNSLARAILANALVEHAHSMVETDWREAETLAKQALDLNPAHPTAKTIRSLILDRKKASPVEEWVAQARKLQSSGDLFAALSRVEEGLDTYPNHPKLLQIQDAIQRDQNLRRRQARRRDLEDLRRMELEIDAAADDAVKKTLADRIQRVAANYWTDGEIIAVANGLLQRLGLVSQASTAASPHGAVIFHVPPRSAPKAARDSSLVATSPLPPNPVAPSSVAAGNLPPATVPPGTVPTRAVATTAPEPLLPPPPAVTIPAAEPSAPVAKVAFSSSQPKRPTRSNSRTLILVCGAAIVVIAVAATFFFAGKHRASPVAKTPSTGPIVSAPAVSTQTVSAPVVSDPAADALAQATPEPASPAPGVSSDTAPGKVTVDDQSGHSLGMLVVVTGQDDARVFLDGKLQRQLTQAGQLRLPNLELKDYVVQVSKSGFQDPPQQTIRIRNGEQARLVFNLQPKNVQPKNVQPQNLQPQPRLASLIVHGGVPGTTVLVDQTLVGTIQPDGSLFVSTVNPGDHIVELRKERFRPRQFQKHFAAGGTISLAAADAVLEAVPEAALGELKITFTPVDAKVAIVRGDLLKTVSSGVPLNLAAGTYTLTARTAEKFTRSSTLEVIAGQSKTLNLSLAPSGMAKWDDPTAWKREGDSFTRKGGDFVLYGVAPASGTFVFSAMVTKGHLLQWVLNYSDPKNYVLFQMDDKNFYRAVIRNGEKTDEIIVPDKGDKKSFRTIQIRVSATELVHQIKHDESWTVLDRWTQRGANLSLGKFGFYIPGNDQVAVSSFAHYADLNIR